MTEKEKRLLLADLSARLPYGIKIHVDFNTSIPSHIVGDALLDTITSCTNNTFGFVNFEQDFNNGDVAPIHGFSGTNILKIDEFKPYLRPMSNMTEEEIYEYELFVIRETNEMAKYLNQTIFYNKYHFDYRGLIPMGLALEAPKGMYNTK